MRKHLVRLGVALSILPIHELKDMEVKGEKINDMLLDIQFAINNAIDPRL